MVRAAQHCRGGETQFDRQPKKTRCDRRSLVRQNMVEGLEESLNGGIWSWSGWLWLDLLHIGKRRLLALAVVCTVLPKRVMISDSGCLCPLCRFPPSPMHNHLHGYSALCHPKLLGPPPHPRCRLTPKSTLLSQAAHPVFANKTLKTSCATKSLIRLGNSHHKSSQRECAPLMLRLST